MKFAYADPPYLGLGKFYADRHPEALPNYALGKCIIRE